jgi:hypothetical protein
MMFGARAVNSQNLSDSESYPSEEGQRDARAGRMERGDPARPPRPGVASDFCRRLSNLARAHRVSPPLSALSPSAPSPRRRNGKKGDIAHLHLDDGSVRLAGRSFGAPVPCSGEVVINTGMVGYPEALTNPSYHGQILVLTFPLVGNYGVPDEAIVDGHGLPTYFEGGKVHIAGLIVSSYLWEHSHWAAHSSLAGWLRRAGGPGMYGVDTRALTKKIRECGKTLLGNLVVVSSHPPPPPLPPPPPPALSLRRKKGNV